MTIIQPPPKLPPPKRRGQSPLRGRRGTGRLCNDFHNTSGSVGSDNHSADPQTATAKPPGTVPAEGRRGNGRFVTTFTILPVLSVLTIIQPRPNRRRQSGGDSPHRGAPGHWAFCNDFLNTSGSVGFDNHSAAPKPPLPKRR
ncbi:MAG UNVERIFIED_CONTAM: hypothetical protein LVR18_43925 [Planctomycetaceae bacterium]